MARILIVEDNGAQRLLYGLELSDMGYKVVLAKNGLEAIEEFRAQKPDLVLLDLLLPSMEGFEILRKLLSANPAIPVIIHTAYPAYGKDDIRWAAEACIVKTSDLTELKNTVRRVLNSKQTDLNHSA